MKTFSRFHPLAVLALTVVSLSGTSEARSVKTYGGGRGYNYRPPSDSRISHYGEPYILPTPRGRHANPGGAVPRVFFGVVKDPYSNSPSIDGLKVNPQRVVAAVQRSLQGLGYYQGAANGVVSRDFERALRRYQAETGSQNSGVIDGGTLDSLGLKVAAFAVK